MGLWACRFFIVIQLPSIPMDYHGFYPLNLRYTWSLDYILWSKTPNSRSSRMACDVNLFRSKSCWSAARNGRVCEFRTKNRDGCPMWDCTHVLSGRRTTGWLFYVFTCVCILQLWPIGRARRDPFDGHVLAVITLLGMSRQCATNSPLHVETYLRERRVERYHNSMYIL